MSQLLDECMKNDLPDPRYWDIACEKWMKDPENNPRPFEHPWPQHPYNLYPEMYDIPFHLKYR